MTLCYLQLVQKCAIPAVNIRFRPPWKGLKFHFFHFNETIQRENLANQIERINKENEILVVPNVLDTTLKIEIGERLSKIGQRSFQILLEKRDSDWTKSLILCPDRKIVLDIINQSKTGKLNLLLRNYTEDDLHKYDENLFTSLGSKSIFTSRQNMRKNSEKKFLSMLQRSEKERPLVDLS